MLDTSLAQPNKSPDAIRSPASDVEADGSGLPMRTSADSSFVTLPALIYDGEAGVWRIHSQRLSSAIICNSIPLKATSNIIPLLERQLAEARTAAVDHLHNCQFILHFLQAQILSRDGTRHSSLKSLILRGLRTFTEASPKTTHSGVQDASDEGKSLLLQPFVDMALATLIKKSQAEELGSSSADLEDNSKEFPSQHANLDQLELDVDMAQFASQLPLLITAKMLGFIPNELLERAEEYAVYIDTITVKLRELADAVEQVFSQKDPLLARVYRAQRAALTFSELVAAALYDMYDICACPVLDAISGYVSTPITGLLNGDQSGHANPAEVQVPPPRCQRCSVFVALRRRLGEIPWPESTKDLCMRKNRDSEDQGGTTLASHSMIESFWQEVLDNRMGPIEMSANLLFLVTAGYETTSSLITSALICRAIHEEVEEVRLIDEDETCVSSAGDDDAKGPLTSQSSLSDVFGRQTTVEEISRVNPPVRRIFRQVHQSARITWIKAQAIAPIGDATASDLAPKVYETAPMQLQIPGREVYVILDCLRRHGQPALAVGVALTALQQQSLRRGKRLEYGFWVIEFPQTGTWNSSANSSSNSSSISPQTFEGCITGPVDGELWSALETVAAQYSLKCVSSRFIDSVLTPRASPLPHASGGGSSDHLAVWAYINEGDFITAEVASSNGVRFGAWPVTSTTSLISGLGPEPPFAPATSPAFIHYPLDSFTTPGGSAYTTTTSSRDRVLSPSRYLGPSITFGVGAHACPGKALAFAEVTATMRRLFQRVSRLRLRVPLRDLEWIDKDSLVTLVSLPMRLTLVAEGAIESSSL